MPQRQLTDAHYHEGSHPIEDAQVLDAEDHMVQEECHQAAEANAGNPKKRQEHWAGRQVHGLEWEGQTDHTPFGHTTGSCLIPCVPTECPPLPGYALNSSHAQREGSRQGARVAEGTI